MKRKIFEVAGRLSKCDIKDTIVLAGTPRSGTTWLLETLRQLPGRKAISEPLALEEAREDRGFAWRHYIPPGGEMDEDQETYLRSVLSGQLGVPETWSFQARTQLGRLVEHATRNRLVAKFCRLNRMLHFFHEKYDVRGTVLIVRHPCAVVSSMLDWYTWNEVELSG